jgi:HAD superfamily hydrolase (TIGR01509 family)
MYLAHNYKDIKNALPLLIEIANKQRPNPKTIQIVKNLKQQGYELAVLSNIGQLIFNDLEPNHHDLFHMFNHIIVATPETHYTSKPNPKIYERLLNETDNTKNMILVDDKEKNICGGLPFGIIGITFKNAKQLQERLKKLHISV